jgi:hypothetical protein
MDAQFLAQPPAGQLRGEAFLDDLGAAPRARANPLFGARGWTGLAFPRHSPILSPSAGGDSPRLPYARTRPRMPRSFRRRRIREQPIADLKRAVRDHIEDLAALKGITVSDFESAKVAGELVALADPFGFKGRGAVIPGPRADLRGKLINAWLDGELPESRDRLRIALSISAAPGSHPGPMRFRIGRNPAPVTEGQLDVAYQSQFERLHRLPKRSRAS